MKAIFHAGMGKTGSSTLQAALSAGNQSLRDGGIHYLGMWMPWLGEAGRGAVEFQQVMSSPPDRLREIGGAYVDYVGKLAAETGIEGFLTSNEGLSSGAAAVFFGAVAQFCDLQVIIYLRPPASWLPSAYVQWGIVHKFNRGPVAPFAVVAPQLMSQYRGVLSLRRALGKRITLRPYPQGGDIVSDFAALLGVELPTGDTRLQSRPSAGETLLRASYNSLFAEPNLPDSFDRAFKTTLARGSTVSGLHGRLFDQATIPAIIDQNRAVLEELGAASGQDLTAVPAGIEEPFDLVETLDDLVGRLLDVATSQALRIAELEGRLSALEAKLGKG